VVQRSQRRRLIAGYSAPKRSMSLGMDRRAGVCSSGKTATSADVPARKLAQRALLLAGAGVQIAGTDRCVVVAGWRDVLEA
jgi:hypothetical protein